MRNIKRAMNYYKYVSTSEHFTDFDKKIASQNIEKLKKQIKIESEEKNELKSEKEM